MILAAALLVYAVATRKTQNMVWRAPLSLLIILLVAVYFLAPNSAAGGGQLSFRLSLFPWIFLILWLAATSPPRRLTALVAAISVAITLVMLGVHVAQYRKLNGYLREYTSAAAHIRSGSTILPICVSDRGLTSNGAPLTLKIRCFIHAGSYLAVQRDLVDLSNYEAEAGYFPILFRPEIDPAKYLSVANGFDILNYPARSGGRGSVDYVFIWQVRESMPTELAAYIEPQLARGYELIFTSPNGFGHLYRRR